MNKVRSFVAINLNDEVRASLEKVEDELRKTGANVRWVPPKNFHLTLLFLGHVEQEKLPDIMEAIRNAVLGIKPFDIEFAGVSGLPRLDKPRVIYVDVKDPTGSLTLLNKEIYEAMKPFGIKLEDRKYIPHMTVGRVITPKNIMPLIETAKRLAGQSFGILHVSTVELMLSDLQPNGPVYTVAGKADLIMESSESDTTGERL